MHSIGHMRSSCHDFPVDHFMPFRVRSLGCACLLAWTTLVSSAEPQAAKPKSIQELKAFFEQNCTRCHGRDGSGRSFDGRKLGGQDFTQAAKEFRTLGGPASEREIRSMTRTIQKGLFFGFTMPGWKDQLSPGDATLMVREVLLKAESGKIITPMPEQAVVK
jgi:mono/diheme cytochrome c family protein